MKNIALKLITVAIGLFLLAACAKNNVHTIYAKTTDFELNQAISLDVVFIYDKTTLAVMSELTNQAWFAQREAILLRFGETLDVSSIELVPVSSVRLSRLPDNASDAIAVVAFAHYLNVGQGPVAIGEYDSVWLVVTPTGLVASKEPTIP